MGNNQLIKIEQQDLRRLGLNLERVKAEINATAKAALSNLGAKIVAESQTNISRNDSKVTGTLINSGSVKESAGGVIMAGFEAIYAYYVEFGRRGGKMPPFVNIYQWVRKRHFTADDNEAEEMAVAIQRKIGKMGTRPRPFLRPVYERYKRIYTEIIRRALAKVTKKDYR